MEPNSKTLDISHDQGKHEAINPRRSIPDNMLKWKQQDLYYAIVNDNISEVQRFFDETPLNILTHSNDSKSVSEIKIE